MLRRICCIVPLLLALAVTGTGAVAASRYRHFAGTTRAGYPSTFVAVSRDSKAPGITVYSSSTGHALRRLTHGDRDIDPMITADHRWIYFVRVPIDPCPVQLWRVPFTGGTAMRLSQAGYPGGPVAVSQDGRMLAYISTPPGACRLQDRPSSLVLVDLVTGHTHRIAANVWGIAWAPDDRTLAVVAPDAGSGRSVIRLISNPLRATPAQLNMTRALPCPTSYACAETSPSFDSHGNLFYAAMISPYRSDYCWLNACDGWTYAIVASGRAGEKVVTARRLSGSAVVPSSVVDAAGTAVLYTLPRGLGMSIWRWSGGSPAPIPTAGTDSVQPVWR